MELTLLHEAEGTVHIVFGKFTGLFLGLGSNFSVASLFCALGIAIAFILLRRRPGKRDVKMRVMLRALFPRRLYRGASFRADLGLLLFNVCAFGVLFGWALLSSEYIGRTTSGALAGLFGVLPKTGLNDFASTAIMTVALFIAYELAYWTDHY